MLSVMWPREDIPFSSRMLFLREQLFAYSVFSKHHVQETGVAGVYYTHLEGAGQGQ